MEQHIKAVRRPLTRGVRRRNGLGPVGAMVLALLMVMPAAGAAGPSRHASPAAVEIPPGVTAGIAVFDRQTGAFTEQHDQDVPFRSASVVKLLLTLDFLWDRGPDYDIPAEDRARLDIMLRSSDDDAASYYWSHDGQSAIIDRMVNRLKLTGTAGPPAGYPGYWGYTAITAADTVRIYRYLLDTAPAPVRDYVMGNLRQSTRCGTDGFDQHFGIPSAFQRPWAVKQGWSGFDSGGCTETAAGSARTATGRPSTAANAADGVDLVRPALHSTGTVGPDDRSIVAAFTLHPENTPYDTAYSALTKLVGSLDVPGAVPAEGS